MDVNPGMPLPGITFTGLPSNAMQVFAQKGNISIGQLKLPLGSGSARVPFAVSYSNRTELITKHEWKAQIGISYDFDSLFASSGTGGSPRGDQREGLLLMAACAAQVFSGVTQQRFSCLVQEAAATNGITISGNQGQTVVKHGIVSVHITGILILVPKR